MNLIPNAYRQSGTKILGVLGALAGTIAMSVTPEQLVSVLGAKGPGAVLVAGGLLTLIRGFQNTGQVPGGPTTPTDKTIRSHWLVALLCVLVGCGLVGTARAQTAPSVTFGAAATTGTGSVTPVLTWSTTPAADVCTATGAWTGDKPAFGTATLPAIMKSATYNLVCSWGKVSVTASWAPPTQNTDGTALTDLAGYKVYWAGSGGAFSQSVAGAGVTSLLVTPNPAGTYDYTVTAINAAGAESDRSNKVTATTGTSSVTKSVGITVNPQPNPPSGVTVK